MSAGACSFCARSVLDCGHLVASQLSPAAICERCVAAATAIFAAQRETEWERLKGFAP
jgi:hypothetical protein